MNTEQQPGPVQPPAPPPPEQAAWGAPPPPPEQRRRWTPRRIGVAVAVAVVIAAGGGVAIYAASGSVSDEAGLSGPQGGGRIVGGPMSELDHGEFQNGEVTAISDTSVTAKSADGYERTYTIDEDTQLVGEIEEGDDVMIMATVEGDTATAATVLDQGEMGQQPPQGGPPRLERN
ncbi:hypothetical protein [Actinophytocola sediminis]